MRTTPNCRAAARAHRNARELLPRITDHPYGHRDTSLFLQTLIVDRDMWAKKCKGVAAVRGEFGIRQRMRWWVQSGVVERFVPHEPASTRVRTALLTPPSTLQPAPSVRAVLYLQEISLSMPTTTGNPPYQEPARPPLR